MGIIGVSLFLLIAYIVSENRRNIHIRQVASALILQFLLGYLMISSESGRSTILYLSQWIQTLVSYGNTGIAYMHESYLGNSITSFGHIFALTILPKLIFFSALISVLYRLGVMALLVKSIGWLLKRLLNLSDVESLAVTSNLFLGHIESAITVKPYVIVMNRSQLFLLVTAGMSSISVGVMAASSAIGISIEYLVTASIMALPGSVLFAKIIQPEGSAQEHRESPAKLNIERFENSLHAAANGAQFGMKLALNIGATLLAFVGLIALFNGMLSMVGDLLGIGTVTLESILGFVLSPLTFLIGIPWEETQIAGVLLGKKLILNEFIAYHELIQYQFTAEGATLSQRSLAIITISLCGFGSLSAIGALIAGIGQLAPSQKHEVARIGLKALLAATLANLTSAAIVGTLI